MQISGMSNFSVIIIPSIISIVLGVMLITSFNPIISILVKKYEFIKGTYEKDQDYLATITSNGIWIKEKQIEKNFIIRSSKLNEEKLMNVTIYEFNNNHDFLKRFEHSY